MSSQSTKLALTTALLCAMGISACSNREAGAPSAAPAEPEITVTGEQLLIIPPKNWTLAQSSNSGKFRRAHYIRDPNAEVRESLTFEYLDPDGLPDPIAFLESMAAEQNERCDEFGSVAIGAGLENGYASAVRLLRCPRRRVNSISTISLAKAVQGNDGYYLIVFEKRAAASRGPEGWQSDHVNEDDVAAWSLYLRQTRVCDSTRPEHPCTKPTDPAPAP